jgi:hypothetical protein
MGPETMVDMSTTNAARAIISVYSELLFIVKPTASNSSYE